MMMHLRCLSTAVLCGPWWVANTLCLALVALSFSTTHAQVTRVPQGKDGTKAVLGEGVSRLTAEAENAGRTTALQDEILADLEDLKPESGAPNGTNEKGDNKASPLQPAKQKTITKPSPSIQHGDNPFPVHPIVARQKAFWIQVFTKYNSKQGLLHDGLVGLPTYASLDLQGMSRREAKRYVRAKKNAIANQLFELADVVENASSLNEAQKRLLERFPSGVLGEELRKAGQNVRFQRGLAKRFKAGIERSGAYLGVIKQFLREHGVPEDLAYLPHVESSFQIKAFSSVGAAGIWQFTVGTGRLFMKVNREIDERRDPITSSRAAAKFLRKNYDRLGSWPLAITAYNHGPVGMARIVRQTKVSDLGVLIETYHGGFFRIASKNFYAEFLAAREVAKNPHKYFKNIVPEKPFEYHEYKLPFYVSFVQAAKALKIDRHTLRAMNPALRRIIWSDTQYIPKGYALRLPKHKPQQAFLAALPPGARKKAQKRTWIVRVRRGDTLYDLGRRYGISWRALASANNIRSSGRILPGQKLILPHRGKNIPKAIVRVKQQRARQAQAYQMARAKVRLEGGNQTPQQNGVLPALGLKILKITGKNPLGTVRIAYGESLGQYADWSAVTLLEMRRINRLSRRQALRLRPGSLVKVPLDAVAPKQFEAKRIAFHQDREAAFFASNRIASVKQVVVRRGQTPWSIAQPKNVPMWLFYRKNPALLNRSIKPGMTITLPIVQSLASSQ